MLKNLIFYIVLIAITFIFMQVLTNKKTKLSIVGTILICCSSFVAYTVIPYTIIFGELIVVALYYFLASKNKYIKALALLILGIALGCYKLLDTGEIIAFRNLSYFTYLAISVWVVLENKSKLKLDKYDKIWAVLYLILAIIISGWMIYYNNPEQISKYPERNGLSYLFSYGYSIFLPFVQTGENYVYASFLSLFPLPLIMAMIYAYKKEKHLNYLMPMILVMVAQSIFCMTKASVFKFIGWSNTGNMSFAASAVGLSCIYLYMYMIANIEENMFKMKDSAKIVLALLVFYFLIPRPEVFMSKIYMYVLAMLVTLLYFLFINFADKRYKKVLLVVLSIWSIVSAVPVLFL